MKTYRCKHAVEAMRSFENREAFAAWFGKHGAVFTVVEEGTVDEGEWILYSDGDFIAMEDDLFWDTYEEVS